jgi:hypothetical protein
VEALQYAVKVGIRAGSLLLAAVLGAAVLLLAPAPVMAGPDEG